MTIEKKYVLVRTYSAGVHFGVFEERLGKEISLLNARRIWSWTGAYTLNEIATAGCQGKISVPVTRVTLTEAIEVIDMTEAAVKALAEVKW